MAHQEDRLRRAVGNFWRSVSVLPPRHRVLLALVGCIALAAAAATFVLHEPPAGPIEDAEISSQAKRGVPRYRPTQIEWANLVIERVEQRSFRPVQVTEGKIAIDENRSTPIFSPYSGRVTRLLVKAGQRVEKGQPLFVIEANDAVQALNDLAAATSGLAKAEAALTWAQTVEQRSRNLYEGRAVPLRDLQQAQSELTAAQNDAQAAQAAVAAARNRLRSLGRSDDEIATFEQNRRITAETTIPAPIDGTILQRRVGPGQYVSGAAGDPAFIIGDLSTVWLTVYVRETDASKVALGQQINFAVPALPGRAFAGKIEFAAAAIDPATRRLLVRASVPNPDGLLRPEMLANVTVMDGDESRTIAVPRSAVIHQGDVTRVWVAREDRTIELRRIRTGVASGPMVQVLDGLAPDDRVITKGPLLIDRASAGS